MLFTEAGACLSFMESDVCGVHCVPFPCKLVLEYKNHVHVGWSPAIGNSANKSLVGSLLAAPSKLFPCALLSESGLMP